MRENKHIVQQIVRAVIFFGETAFRGDVEDLSLRKNPDNFFALLKYFAETDAILSNHLNNPQAKNATYISPRSQNDIIPGYDVILTDIVAEVKNSKYFSVLADEVSCHNVEHLPLCLRFVDGECNIREEFIAF